MLLLAHVKLGTWGTELFYFAVYGMETEIQWVKGEDGNMMCRSGVQIVQCAVDMDCRVAVGAKDLRIKLSPKLGGRTYGYHEEENVCRVDVQTDVVAQTSTPSDEMATRCAAPRGQVDTSHAVLATSIVVPFLAAVVVVVVVYVCWRKVLPL